MGTVHYLRNADRHRRPVHRRRRTSGAKSAKSRPNARGPQTRERGLSVIPFPTHRTTTEGPRASSRQARLDRMRGALLRCLLVLFSLGSMALGFAGLEQAAWLSYLQVVLGLLGVVEAVAIANPSRGRRSLLGWSGLLIGGGALLSGVSGWPLLWTVAFGLLFVWSARRNVFPERRG